MTTAPWRPLSSRPPAVDVDHLPDGELRLRCPYPPASVPRSVAHVLIEAAAAHPERTLIAEKDASGNWQYLTYGEAVAGARRVAQWLLDAGAGADRPIAILSGSSRRHFLLAWGAVFARVPTVPVSLSYSTVRGAWPKLAAVLNVVEPAFLFAETIAPYAEALQGIEFDLSNRQLISPEATHALSTTQWRAVIDTEPTAAVDASIEAINHDTVYRYMFTSGSTGMPKGVIYTHGMTAHMLASNAGLQDDAPDPDAGGRVLEWMPWSHVGAGVMRMASMIASGTSIWLDTGKPTPAEFSETVANLPQACPTAYAGAPLGWSMVADALEADPELAQTFFSHLRTMQFGSAAMPTTLAQRLQALTVRYTGERIAMGTALASTEVATGLSRYWISESPDVLGLPVPGVEMRLLPLDDDKYEVRVRGPGITPGYLNDPEKTAAAFDDEDFFCMGDALRFADADDPAAGLVFAGRVAEEFKLQTGTWVSAGTLRSDVVAAASPLVRDAVICGLNQTCIALLLWPNLAACGEIAGTEDPSAICANPSVRGEIRAALDRHNQANPGSSRRIERFLLLAEAPDPGRFEITDKGYINQAEVQRRRASEVERLFAQQPDLDVVAVSPN